MFKKQQKEMFIKESWIRIKGVVDIGNSCIAVYMKRRKKMAQYIFFFKGKRNFDWILLLS